MACMTPGEDFFAGDGLKSRRNRVKREQRLDGAPPLPDHSRPHLLLGLPCNPNHRLISTTIVALDTGFRACFDHPFSSALNSKPSSRTRRNTVTSNDDVPRPRKGFKRLYYLTTPDHAISNIAFKRLKLARLSDLNDPFELLGVSFRDQPGLRRLIEENKVSFNKDNGLVCFSDKWSDPVLWSHYAAKHRGVAFGFDVDRSIGIKKVDYNPERIKPMLTEPLSSIPQEVTDMLLITKFASWQYEREWRVFINLTTAYAEGELYFVPFSPSIKLVEVILGPLCAFDLERTRSLVGSFNENVVTFKSRLANWSFKVIRQSN
jgi:hypothetical protein